MPTFEDYEAIKSRQQQVNVGRANIVLSQSWKQGPDEFAADLAFAKEASAAVGNPVPLLMVQSPTTRSIFQRILDEKQRSTILSNSPQLTEWLRVPDNAGLARDDLDGLSWWEATMNLGSRAAANLQIIAGQNKLETQTQIAQDRGQSFTDILANQSAVNGVAKTVPNLGDLLGAGRRWFNATTSEAFGTDNAALAAEAADFIAKAQKQFADNPQPETVFNTTAFSGGPDFASAAQAFSTAVAQDPMGMMTWMVNVLGENIAPLASAVATTAVTKNPAAGAAVAFGAGYETERALSAVEYLQENGVDLASPDGVQRILSDPELLRGMAERGHTRGLITAAFEAMGIGAAGVRIVKNPVMEAVIQSVDQAILGSTGEATARAASGQDMDFNEILAEGLAGVATLPLDLGVAGRKWQLDSDRATSSRQTVETLEEIAAQATASVTRARSPDTFRDFVATVTAGGSRENMFVPAVEFNEYFQSRGIDPFDLADQLAGMDRDDLQTAIDTGGSVQIPTATWAADMAGSEHDAFIIQNSAFDPGAMTGTQAAEFEATKNDLLAEAWAEAEAVRQDAETTRQIYDQERDQLVGELRAAGRATDVATAEALPMVEFRRVMAGRMGLTPEEFAARYPLADVRGQRPEGLDPKNVDELTRTLAEARARRTVGMDKATTPLLEFISERGGVDDPGGELAARDAATVKRPGKKTLKLARSGVLAGMRDMLGGSGIARGMDDTARAAVESGFMADDPDVIAWLAAERDGTEAPDLTRALLRAIDAELRGPDPVAVDDMGGIEEYLAGLGVALTDDDGTIRAAIEGDTEGRAYGQGAVATDTPAFRQWFGDSKVVGPDGKPLVVYHGTPEQFEAFDPDMSDGNLGIFFSGNKKLASEYTQGEGQAIAAYLKIENPLALNWEQEAKSWAAAGNVLENERFNDPSMFDYGLMNDLVFRAREAGNDGLVLSDIRDGWDADSEKSTTYIAFEPTQIKSVNNRGTFDANDPRLLFQADAGFQGGGARGSIQFPGSGIANGQTIISLFQTADLTTFLHETGHYFLTVARDAAALDPTGPIAADFETVKAWWRDNADAVARDAGGNVTADDVRLAIDNGTTGNLDTDRLIDTGMQEQFARATEQYFMEGKAPSAALKQAFEKFRAWLVSVYKSIRGLNVNVSDDMRAVFDRMLATDAEIQQARTDAGTDIALTADDLGMTAEQFASFTKLRDQAQTDATARTLDEAMRPIRRAATKAYREERAKVRARIETETKQQPVYRAIQEMRFGKDFDGADVTPLKLDRAVIEQEYGAGYIPYLPGATKDGRGHRNAVFSTEGGVHPDIAASAYGFPTGRDMLDRLTNAPDMDALIEAETNKEMEFRHNDPLKDGSIQQQAMDSVHNDLQGQVLAARLDAFNEIAGTDRGLTHKAAREAARRSLRGMAIKDATRADRFLAAERKAAAEVAKLSATVTRTSMWMDAARRRVEKQARGAVRAGDAKAALSVDATAANQSTARRNEQADALVEASRRQLLNHMLYSEARKVAAETDATIKRVSMLRKANARLSKTRDINFVLAARAVAGRFGMTRPDAAFDFKTWMEQLRFDDPVTALAMTTTIETYSQDAKPYKDLTVAEFGAVKDAVESLLALAKTTRALEIDGVRLDRQTAIDALITQVEPRAKVRTGTTAAPTKGERKKLSALTAGAALVRTEAWARDMDDGKAGVFTRYLVKPVMDALGEYRQARTVRLDELLAIVEPRRGELLGKAVNAPELGYTFENKGALLHALLHTGNESNKKKLLLGRGWSKGMINAKQAVTKAGAPRVDRQGNAIMDKGTLDTSQWDAMVERLIADGTITAADKKMIEDIWALMESLKRPAQTAHKRIYGHYFSEIEAAPFTNSLGTWRGGYVPAIIDQYASIDAGKQDAAAALDSQMDASMFPTTGSGFTKGRVEYNQPLALNLQSLPGHMDKVLRFTHLEPTIRQTASLLADRGLREAVSAVNRDAIDAILTPWLMRTARQAVEAPAVTASGRQFGNVMRAIRKRVGLHMMALNVVNAAQQVTGIPSAAVLVKIKHLKGATVRFATDAGTMRTEAVEASAMMRDRMDNSSRMTGQEIDKIITEPSIPAEVDRFVSQHGYVLQQGMQNMVDVIVWHGAYDQAIQQGMTDADAVFEADSVVRRTQGSFNPEDVSAFETGTAFQRVFTMFTSYFNTQLNLIGGEALTTIRTMGWSGGPRLFHLYFLGVMMPAVLAEAVSLAARGELGDEDDDGLTDDMLELFLGSQVKFLAGMVPLVGTLTVAALNKFNDQPFDDQLSVSPANYLLERAVGAPGTIAGAVTGNGSASKATADGITALGLILGVPTGQLAKSASYIGKVAEGRAEPENVGDVLRGLTSGRDGTE